MTGGYELFGVPYGTVVSHSEGVDSMLEGDNRDGRFYFTVDDVRSTLAAKAMIDNEATATFHLQR